MKHALLLLVSVIALEAWGQQVCYTDSQGITSCSNGSSAYTDSFGNLTRGDGTTVYSSEKNKLTGKGGADSSTHSDENKMTGDSYGADSDDYGASRYISSMSCHTDSYGQLWTAMDSYGQQVCTSY